MLREKGGAEPSRADYRVGEHGKNVRPVDGQDSRRPPLIEQLQRNAAISIFFFQEQAGDQKAADNKKNATPIVGCH